MRGYQRGLLSAVCACAMLSQGPTVLGQTGSPLVPLVPGLTFVLAAHDAPPPGARPSISNIAQGDYEMAVTVTGVGAGGIDEMTRFEALDENRKPLNLTIKRRVRAADLANARQQMLGFHTDDALELQGMTSLGPSLAIVHDLRTTGKANYSVITFAKLPVSTGTMTRVGSATVPFPVLLNGQRVELPAIRVTGQLTYSTNKVRSWEQYIYDHPQHPITLRLAYGAEGAAAGAPPAFSREVVRIDFPAPLAIETTLGAQCHVEAPGIYFDFNRATLDPRSSRGLTTIADVLRKQPTWRLNIEGHTDNIGGDDYNQDLSTRRAAAVKAALVSDYAIAATRLASAGFGERRPVETNETIAGRAHNRRVELVRDCTAK